MIFRDQEDAQQKLAGMTAHESRIMTVLGVLLIAMFIPAIIFFLVILVIFGLMMLKLTPPAWLLVMGGLSFGSMGVLAGIRLVLQGIFDVNKIIHKMTPAHKTGLFRRIHEFVGGLIALGIGAGIIWFTLTAMIYRLSR